MQSLVFTGGAITKVVLSKKVIVLTIVTQEEITLCTSALIDVSLLW